MNEDSAETKAIAWSYSGARLFTSCPRAFFYQHQSWSSNDEVDADSDFDPETAEIRSPGALVGTAVHQSIRQQIDRWRKGDSPSMVDAQSTATDIIREYCDTRDFPDEYREQAAHTKEISRKQDSLSRTATSHLQTFFQVIWPQFASNRYIQHEIADSFTVQGHTVWVRPDLCTRDSSGTLVITDWKTSSFDLWDQSLQLKVYALWAHRQYEPDLNRIQSQRVHTGTGEFDRVTVDRPHLDAVIERIVADCEDWNARSDQSQFPPDPEISKCHKCRYLNRCEPGQSKTQ